MADRTGSTRFALIELPDKKLPLSRVRLDRDAFWRRALGAYRDGFQSYSTDSELDQIVRRNSGYNMPDPWEEPVGIFLKQRERTPYVTFQDIYGVLDIPAVRHQRTTPSASSRSRPIAGGFKPAAGLAPHRSESERSSPITSTSPQAGEQLSRASRALRRNPLHTHQQPPSLFSNCLGKGVGQVGHHATDLTVAT